MYMGHDSSMYSPFTLQEEAVRMQEESWQELAQALSLTLSLSLTLAIPNPSPNPSYPKPKPKPKPIFSRFIAPG